MVNGWAVRDASDRFYTSVDGQEWADITTANTVQTYANPNFAQGITIPDTDTALIEFTWSMWAISTTSAFTSTSVTNSERFNHSYSRTRKGAIQTGLTSATLKQVAPLNVNYTTSL
jgi:hypothetical protein